MLKKKTHIIIIGKTEGSKDLYIYIFFYFCDDFSPLLKSTTMGKTGGCWAGMFHEQMSIKRKTPGGSLVNGSFRLLKFA